MNNEIDRIELTKYWWSKSNESLDCARREFEAKCYGFAMNRLYYAAFYGVCAALIERHKTYKKHSGVRAAFHREFVKTGLIDTEYGKLYDQLFEDRQEGDYIAFVTFESHYVEIQINRCSQFLHHLSILITSLTKL